MGNKFIIKFDKADVRFLKGLVVIILLSFTLLCIAVGMCERVLLIIILESMLPFVLYAVSLLFEAKGYLKRLEQYGFCVPEQKKAVANGLLGLEQRERRTDKKPQYSVQSIILAVFSGFGVLGIMYASSRSKTPHYFTIFISVLIMVYYVIQISNKWFRDDVDIFGNNNRFIRKNIPDGIFKTTIVFVFLYLFGIFAIEQLPVTNGHYYSRVMEYNEKDGFLTYDFFPKEIPEDVSELKFVADAEKCRVSFLTTKEEAEKFVTYFSKEVGLKNVYTVENDELFEIHIQAVKRRLFSPERINKKCILITENEVFWACIDVEKGFVSFGY